MASVALNHVDASLHKHCFQFLLGLTMVPRENKNNAYAKFGRINKEYYGSGLLELQQHNLHDKSSGGCMQGHRQPRSHS